MCTRAFSSRTAYGVNSWHLHKLDIDAWPSTRPAGCRDSPQQAPRRPSCAAVRSPSRGTILVRFSTQNRTTGTKSPNSPESPANSPSYPLLDNDQNTEIVIGSNTNCNVGCPAIDPIHRGVRCMSGADCGSNTCDAGYCRCQNNNECTAGHVCAAPPAMTPGVGNTCRAEHPIGAKKSGVRILRDQLDRWSSSRPIWNQHAYNVTNVNDDATIPQTAKWNQNFLDPTLNNYRQNQQGDIPPTALPDITTDKLACGLMGNTAELSAEVCNRGIKTVGAGLKIAFYEGDPMDGKVLCVATTDAALESEQCVTVSCQHDGVVMGNVTVNGNDDGMGGKTTLECIYTNNDDKAVPIMCK